MSTIEPKRMNYPLQLTTKTDFSEEGSFGMNLLRNYSLF